MELAALALGAAHRALPGLGHSVPHRHDEKVRNQREERRVADGAGICQRVGALSEIVHDQRRKDGEEPRNGDRPAAEVREVRVERFSSGDAQHDGAEDQQAARTVVHQKRDAVRGQQRAQNLRVADD
jgi:hypothetical protein